MRILVIGGTRFIGPRVIDALVDAGHAVTILHRGRTAPAPAAGVGEIRLDRQRLAEGAGAIRQLAPEVVIDMIPLGERDAEELVRVLRGVAGRVVAVSSADVYLAYGRLHGTEPGPPVPAPMDEEAPLRTRLYPYRGATPRAADDPQRRLDDYDKILVERVVLGEPELPGTVLRLPMVYGPGDYQHRTYDYVRRMDDDRPAILLERGVAAWRLPRGYVEDVAGAIALAATRPEAAGRIYNVCEERALTERQWVEAIAAAAGWRGRVVVVERDGLPDSLRSTDRTDQHLACTSARIRRELGYVEQTDRRQALERTIAWERTHPPQPIDPARFDYAAEDAVVARLGV
ncbi:MAG: NAD-dependent epimerase/dehydratase family protein [Candidatus Eiseniibacteriota bacterium]|jgi:nucleoside-diphosphate-sugar epimerase